MATTSENPTSASQDSHNLSDDRAALKSLVLPAHSESDPEIHFPPLKHSPPDGERSKDLPLLSFMREAEIQIFSAAGLPSPDQHTSYNDDIRLGSCRPIRYTWAGGQRGAISMHIGDASPIDDHRRKSSGRGLLPVGGNPTTSGSY